MKDVYIYEEIYGDTLRSFLEQVGSDKEPVVHINSFGGDVFAGIAIYNMLKRSDSKVIVEGLAASIASVILMGGKDRVMSSGSMLMIHNPWSFMGGNASDMEKAATDLRKIESVIIDIYEEATGADREVIKGWMDAETWFTAEEAVNMGFADRIDDDVKIAAKLDLTKCGFKNLTMYKEMMNMSTENTEDVTQEATQAIEPEATTPEPETVVPVEPEVTPEVEPEPEGETETTPEAKGALYTDDQIAEIKKQAVLDDIKRQNEIKALAVEGQGDLVNKLIVAHASVADAALAIAQDMKERIMPNMMNRSDDPKAELYAAFENGAPPAMSQSVGVDDVVNSFAKAKGVEASKIYNENRDHLIKNFYKKFN